MISYYVGYIGAESGLREAIVIDKTRREKEGTGSTNNGRFDGEVPGGEIRQNNRSD